jgi:hypothetical protein
MQASALEVEIAEQCPSFNNDLCIASRAAVPVIFAYPGNSSGRRPVATRAENFDALIAEKGFGQFGQIRLPLFRPGI